MGKLEFTPIAMKCTQEQFEAIKPKLKHLEICSVTSFDSYPYLINTDSSYKRISNVNGILLRHGNYKIYETWNEKIFLKACGIEVSHTEKLKIYDVIESICKTCGIPKELLLRDYPTRGKSIVFDVVNKIEKPLQQQLEKAEAEVKRLQSLIEEENNIKIGDWVKRTYKGLELFKADDTHDYRYINSEKHLYQKITNPELIKLLENERRESL